MKQIQFKLVAYTDPAGKWDMDAPLEGNEDNLFVDIDLGNHLNGEMVFDRTISLSDEGCLMVVADGMGGLNAGEVASGIAIMTVENAFCYNQLKTKSIHNAKQRAAYMEQVIKDADYNIKAYTKSHPECEGMGSTLIMAWLQGGEVTVSWIGDSRAYLFRNGCGLRQISHDHSYVQDLVDSGQLAPELAFDHPNGNIITRSLGDVSKPAKPDSITLPVGKGDVIMLNSDGLSGVLRDNEMEQIIQTHFQSLNECRIALWNAAKRAGWYDNVTAIICQIVEGEEFSADSQMIPVYHSKSLSVFSKHTSLYIILLGILVIGLCALGLWLHRFYSHSSIEEVSTSIMKDSVIEQETTSIVMPMNTPDSRTKQTSLPESRDSCPIPIEPDEKGPVSEDISELTIEQ